jgi:hypothetical protein
MHSSSPGRGTYSERRKDGRASFCCGRRLDDGIDLLALRRRPVWLGVRHCVGAGACHQYRRPSSSLPMGRELEVFGCSVVQPKTAASERPTKKFQATPSLDPLFTGLRSPNHRLPSPHPMAGPVPVGTHANLQGPHSDRLWASATREQVAYERLTSQFGPNGLHVTRPLACCPTGQALKILDSFRDEEIASNRAVAFLLF